MKSFILVIGIAAGTTATILGRRYIGAFLWWTFTTDVRSSR